MTLAEFKTKKPKKRVSSLDKFQNEILELWEDNYSQNTILEFLKTKEINVSQPALSQWLQKKASVKKEVCVSKPEVKKVESSKITKEEKTKSDENDDFLNIDFSKKVGPNFDMFHVEI